MKYIKGIVVSAMIAMLALVMTGCGTVVKTGQDQQAVWYEDGDFSAQKFKGCKAPAQRSREGLGDSVYYYPVGQRTYSFTGRDGSEAGPVTVKTKDFQQLIIPGFITFELTSDCETLRQFHEQIGNKYQAYFSENNPESVGWNKFLNDYLAVPLNSISDKGGIQYNWQELAYDPKILAQYEEYIVTEIGKEIEAAVGIPGALKVRSVNVETPQPDPALVDANTKVEAAKKEKQVQDEKNKVNVSKYQTLEDCKRVASDEACLVIYLSEQGDVPFYPLPPGSGVNVNGN